MSTPNIDLINENNDFDQGNFFIQSMEESKFDIGENIYTSLDLNDKSTTNSTIENEFDLEQIKRKALVSSESSPSSECSKRIKSLLDIDIVITSEERKDIINKKTELFDCNNKMEKIIAKASPEIISKPKTLQLTELNSQTVFLVSDNVLEIESPAYEPMSPQTNKENSELAKENIIEDISRYKNKFVKLTNSSENMKQEVQEIINKDTRLIPSPFLTFTPPLSPVSISSREFKKENSVDISDYFERDYFEDDNLSNFPQEEVYTDEIIPNYTEESTEAIQQLEVYSDISNDNSNDRNRFKENVEDVIMNDHNYFNQEENITTSESYIKHTNILNNSLNIIIKNFPKSRHSIEKQMLTSIDQRFTEIFEKMNDLKTSLNLILKKESIETNFQSQIFEIETLRNDEINKKKIILKHLNEQIENVNITSVVNTNDFQIENNIKEFDISTEKEKNLNEFCVVNNNFENKSVFDESKNISETNENGKLDLSLIKTETNIKIEFQNNNDIVHEKSEETKNIIPCAMSEQLDEKPWTKYRSLIALAKSILDIPRESKSDTEISKCLEKSRKEFSEILIYPNLIEKEIQTDHSGKFYSERRLKYINEKEKRRLLDDTSDSSDFSSEYESDTQSKSQIENNLNNEEQDNILNGIDFSKYLDSSNDDSDNFPNDFSEHLDVILEEDENEILPCIDENQINCSNINNSGSVNGKGCFIKKSPSVTSNTNNKHARTTNDSNLVVQDSVDKDIERLLDFKALANKRINLNYRYINNDKKNLNKKIITQHISEILAEEDKKRDSSDGTDSEGEDCVANENTYLIRQNENLKKQMLESSSSSSDHENDCNIILPDDIDDDDENEEFDESKPSLVEKFLLNYAEVEDKIDQIKDDKINETHNKQMNISEKSPELKEGIENDKREKDCPDLENKENDIPDEDSDKQNVSSDCEILDKTFALLKQANKKRKSLDTLLVEDQRRRKNLKINDEIFSLSSDDESDNEERKIKKTEPHRIIRPIMKSEQLTSETKKAQKEEQSRLNRLKKKENILKKAYKEHNRDPSDIRELILDYSTKSKQFITVHNDLVSHLKQHQIDGVKFMYDCCYGSVNFIDESPGSGCILAHCMGLGKTLQLITLIHTLIIHKELKTSRILILCPKSTVMNWAEEIQRWLGPLGVKNIKVFTFNDVSDISDKMGVLQEWYNCGSNGSHNSGCLLVGYEAFRTLVSYPTKKNRNLKLDIEEIKVIIKKTLLDPGADLVVCDEGHIIKNRRAAISQAVTEIRTSRRIVLTGTPIQNNLKEYYSMVNFIKPSYLGTEKEFANLYANPIKNGQHKDSSKRDIKIMKQRSFVLHSKLSSFVQRREAALLKTFLPQKFEYVLFIPMTPVQVKLYEIFLEAVGKREDTEKKGRNLLTDYTCLRKIWTHPKVLENAYNNAILLKNKKEKKASNLDLASDEDQPDDIYDSLTGLMSVTSDWWRQHLVEQDLKSTLPSNKLQTMFEILRMCAENREKCLIFSAFVAVLNVVEFFMNLINQKTVENAKEFGIDRFNGPWINGKDYYRLDGKTPKTLRHEMVKSFNDPTNNRARVFLISAKAGGQGINLIGANRVIILDTSWNPSNDQQNIFRIFRLGQKRNCYIYRLISFGTMEEKVYSRSVTKQAMSFRVVDEHQIDRHYSMAELAELYTLTKPDYSNRPIPNLPQDNILAHLLRNFPQYVFKYHEHDSLLENKIEQELSEQEKEDAWLAYENEINSVANAGFPNLQGLEMFGAQPLPNAMPPFNNFSRSPSSSDIFNQGRMPVSSQFFPGLNFTNKNYLDSMFSYFSNTNPLYGGIDLTKSPVYGDTINSNFLLPNNRSSANNIGIPNSPISSPNYQAIDSLHIPSSHSSAYSQNLSPYNSLYSNASNLLNSPLSRFNNTSLENFKRVFENYVNPSTNVTAYSSNQNKNLTNNELRTITPDMNSAVAKGDVNFRKHNLHPNFSASLASSSTGSMTNSILNAQNRLINQSTDMHVPQKKNSSGTLTTNVQKDAKMQQPGINQFSKQTPALNCSSNSFPAFSPKINHQVRPSKTSPSDNTKTDTLRNAAFNKIKNDSSIQNRASSPQTTITDSNDKINNKLKPVPTQISNMVKNQNILIPTSNTKTQANSSGNKILASNSSQNHSILNSTFLESNLKTHMKQPSNFNKSSSQSISNSAGKVAVKNFAVSKGRTNSPTHIEPLNKKNVDTSNTSKTMPSQLTLTNKNCSILNKSSVQLNQEGPKAKEIHSSNFGTISKVNKVLVDPLSTSLEDKLISGGISISKKSAMLKLASNPSGKQSNQLKSQLQSSLPQRKRSLNHDINVKPPSSMSNKFDPVSKKPKLTPKELAEELSSSLKRIQSSKGLTIVHKNPKGPSSSDVLELD